MLGVLLPLISAGILFAADFQVPALTGPVVDNAAMLSAGTKSELDSLLRQVRKSGGTQLQILTVPDLGGLSIEEAGIKVTDQWKLGSAKDDNGVLLLVAAKERRVRIEVGQGREGDLPDVIASRIIREVIVPRFREGDANGAILDGAYVILHYTDPEFDAKTGRTFAKKEPVVLTVWKTFLFLFLFGAFIYFQVFIAPFARRGGVGGGFGGGGGGGWSGGGGGFSGGGASGSW
jgi:uncharacterized protein